MVKDRNGLKDKVVGKLKETQGKITGNKTRELEGKAQHAKGKAKGKINDVKKDLDRKLEKKKEEV